MASIPSSCGSSNRRRKGRQRMIEQTSFKLRKRGGSLLNGAVFLYNIRDRQMKLPSCLSSDGNPDQAGGLANTAIPQK